MPSVARTFGFCSSLAFEWLASASAVIEGMATEKLPVPMDFSWFRLRLLFVVVDVVVGVVVVVVVPVVASVVVVVVV